MNRLIVMMVCAILLQACVTTQQTPIGPLVIGNTQMDCRTGISTYGGMNTDCVGNTTLSGQDALRAVQQSQLVNRQMRQQQPIHFSLFGSGRNSLFRVRPSGRDYTPGRYSGYRDSNYGRRYRR